jgi:hypothetical protein
MWGSRIVDGESWMRKTHSMNRLRLRAGSAPLDPRRRKRSRRRYYSNPPSTINDPQSTSLSLPFSSAIPRLHFNVSGKAVKSRRDDEHRGTDNFSGNAAIELVEHVALPIDSRDLSARQRDRKCHLPQPQLPD